MSERDETPPVVQGVKVFGSAKDCEVADGMSEIFLLQCRTADGKSAGQIGENGEYVGFISESAAREWLDENAARIVEMMSPSLSFHIVKVTVGKTK